MSTPEPKRAWAVWDKACVEAVVFTSHSDALMTAQGFEALDDYATRGHMVPTIGLAFTEYYDGPYTVQEIAAPDCRKAVS